VAVAAQRVAAQRVAAQRVAAQRVAAQRNLDCKCPPRQTVFYYGEVFRFTLLVHASFR